MRNEEEDSKYGAGSFYNYKYNGKELQDTGLYDYGWRQYMPELGRWNGMDQLSEMYSSASPFAYVLNNPVMLIDPDGRCPNRPEGELCPDAPGGTNNPIDIEEVVVRPKPKSNAIASDPFPTSDYLGWNWGLGGSSGTSGSRPGGSSGSSGGGLGGGFYVGGGYRTPEISISNRPTFRPKYSHDGYEYAMKLIDAIEGAIGTIESAKFALHKEVLRFN